MIIGHNFIFSFYRTKERQKLIIVRHGNKNCNTKRMRYVLLVELNQRNFCLFSRKGVYRIWGSFRRISYRFCCFIYNIKDTCISPCIMMLMYIRLQVMDPDMISEYSFHGCILNSRSSSFHPTFGKLTSEVIVEI